ncbi:MAG: GxxExxY protein [Gammaproteobacteria bacterium]|nr:GxxExxY protein [Gammaproteobacteria bacterium]
MEENDIAHAVIGAAIEVHKALGPGLLESTYQTCLRRELALRGIAYEAEFPIAVRYKGATVTDAYRGDLPVRDKVIVELKAVDLVMDVHKAQVLTYLRLTGRRLGLLLNFNVVKLRSGIFRIAHRL